MTLYFKLLNRKKFKGGSLKIPPEVSTCRAHPDVEVNFRTCHAQPDVEVNFRTCHVHPDVEVPELGADIHAGTG